jgi:putative ABC transport system ATP-binding protein/lipoprotein-releasing system ATP-binding protein
VSISASSSTGDGIAIAARDVFRTFQIGESQIEVLRGVTLEVEKGETLFLVGPSGAGKTSLLYTLAGLERPNKGEVVINGRSLYRLPRKEQANVRNRTMGYVFQSFFLLPELTALENVMVPSMIRGKRGEDRGRELLERVGLGERTGHLPTELSGGEQQRVAIARALMNNPEIIFADEPTGNLDTTTGAAVMGLLMDLANEEKRTLLVVTHDPGLARTGDRTVTLVDGVISV